MTISDKNTCQVENILFYFYLQKKIKTLKHMFVLLFDDYSHEGEILWLDL